MQKRIMVAAALAAAAASAPVAADELADFYKGKTVSIVVSTGEEIGRAHV